MVPAVAIVLAAGSGERLGTSVPKAFVELAGRPILVRSAAAALASPGIGWVVVAVPAGHEDLAHAMLEHTGAHGVVTGGDTRQASVRAAMAVVPDDAPLVVCHDAARPFASTQLFSAVLGALEVSPEADGAVPVVPVPDTVQRVRDGFVVGCEDRQGLVLAQAPQAFRTPALRDAHARASEAGLEFTDDAGVLEWAGYRVKTVGGDPDNFKITTAEDLARAEARAEEMGRG